MFKFYTVEHFRIDLYYLLHFFFKKKKVYLMSIKWVCKMHFAKHK